MKVLRQSVNKLEVAHRGYGVQMHDTSPQELLLKWVDNSTFPETAFPKGTKFELVETVENGWLDGRGDKHLVRNVRMGKVFIFRGSLTKAFILEEDVT